ncbi:MAG: hypothetical protein AAF720_01080 [Pseudomonadota bacterium]
MVPITKKWLFTVVAILSLVFFSVPVLAQTAPSVTVQQIGPENIAEVSAVGTGTRVDAAQVGRRNSLVLSANGQDNQIDTDQRGNANGAGLVVTGDTNRVALGQRSDGAVNAASLLQNGVGNEIDTLQFANGLVAGFANSLQASQNGDFNYAGIEQTATSADAAMFANVAVINQTGNRNRATLVQDGINNSAEQEQVGSDNISDILQTGDNNSAVHRQIGDGLSLPAGTFGTIGIEQTGGASIIVEQFGPGLGPSMP